MTAPKEITRTEGLAIYQAALAALAPDIVVTGDSDAGIKGQLVAEAVNGLSVENLKTWYDIWISSDTSPEGLERHIEARLSGGRKGATIASGIDVLEVTGTPGSTVQIGDELVSSDGQTYQLTSGGAIPSVGPLTVSVESIDVGTVANRDAGESLTFVAPPAGIDPKASVVGSGIAGGFDQETDAEVITRLLDAVRNPPAGGRFSDYRQTAEAVEGVLRAYCYGPSTVSPNGRRGLGIIDVCITANGYGEGRIPSQTIVDNVEDAIELMRPHSTRDIAVIVPDPTDPDHIEAEITPSPGYEFDWDRYASYPVFVESYDPATRTMILDETVANFSPSGRRALKVGDRCLVLTGTTLIPATEINTVKRITDNFPVGKASVVFENSFFFSPQLGNEFWPAGPLTQPLVDAMTELFASLGPAKRDTPLGAEWSDPEQDWDHILRTDRIACTLRGEGVLGVNLITPVANIEPDDPGYPGLPELLMPGWFNIRPAEI